MGEGGNGEIRSVGDLLARIDETGILESWGSHVRLWLRGQAAASWGIEPNVYRAGYPADEDEQIKVERHLTQDFLSYAPRLLTGDETDAEIYFIQQHHGMPTRLVDWTGNPLAALYFATDGEPKADGAVFLLDSYQFSDRKGHYTVRNREFGEAMRCIFDFGYDGWPKVIMPVRPPLLSPRIVAQSGYFTFHPKGRRYLEEKDNASLRKYVVPADAKEKLRRELNLLNINGFTVYGGLDRLSAWLKTAYVR